MPGQDGAGRILVVETQKLFTDPTCWCGVVRVDRRGRPVGLCSREAVVVVTVPGEPPAGVCRYHRRRLVQLLAAEGLVELSRPPHP